MLQRGALEACLDDLRRADAEGDPQPDANCRLAEAIAHAEAACDLAPQNPEFALHAAALLASRRRCDEAAALALHAAASSRDGRTAIDSAEVLLRCERADDAAALLSCVAAGA